MTRPPHDELILDQFTRQAVPFSTAKTIADERALQLLVDFSGAGSDDTVLDVACGGGLVVCAFARRVRHATGIDVTPAMLERARDLAQKQGLGNVSLGPGQRRAAALSGRRLHDRRFAVCVPPLSGPTRGPRRDGARVRARRARAGMRRAGQRRPAEGVRIQPDGSAARSVPRARDARRGAARAVPGGGVARAAGGALRAARRAGESTCAARFRTPETTRGSAQIFRAAAGDDRLGIPIRLAEAEVHYAYPVLILCADRS